MDNSYFVDWTNAIELRTYLSEFITNWIIEYFCLFYGNYKFKSFVQSNKVILKWKVNELKYKLYNVYQLHNILVIILE